MATTESADSAPVVPDETDRSILPLVGVVMYKQLLLLVRYPVNTLSRVVTLYIFFALIFYGGQAVAGPAITNTLDGIVVGFFLFTVAMAAYSGLSWNVTREAQWGTLERLFMSPLGFGTVMVVKTLVNVFMSFLWGFLLLALMLITTDTTLHLDPLTILPLGVLTVASVVGIGFTMAGLALVYKRIENAFQLLQFAFVGLIAAPVGGFPWLGLLPLAQGSYLTRRAMEGGVRLWEFAPAELAILVGTAVGYLLLGYYCFHRAQRRARRKGLLGHY